MHFCHLSSLVLLTRVYSSVEESYTYTYYGCSSNAISIPFLFLIIPNHSKLYSRSTRDTVVHVHMSGLGSTKTDRNVTTSKQTDQCCLIVERPQLILPPILPPAASSFPYLSTTAQSREPVAVLQRFHHFPRFFPPPHAPPLLHYPSLPAPSSSFPLPLPLLQSPPHPLCGCAAINSSIADVNPRRTASTLYPYALACASASYPRRTASALYPSAPPRPTLAAPSPPPRRPVRCRACGCTNGLVLAGQRGVQHQLRREMRVHVPRVDERPVSLDRGHRGVAAAELLRTNSYPILSWWVNLRVPQLSASPASCRRRG